MVLFPLKKKKEKSALFFSTPSSLDTSDCGSSTVPATPMLLRSSGWEKKGPCYHNLLTENKKCSMIHRKDPLQPIYRKRVM
ncbi:hypothetical protein GLYMA_01G165750v4 [Glycine max]|nr:hypothetical protein GLYMA_01G165750v4 [Glycine max]KAH1163468.1 hypothetical protein GYH30_001809 [Glycine max]